MPESISVCGAFDRPIRIAALISGGGRTVLNLVKKITAGQLSAEISVVIASRADCRGVQRMADASLTCKVLSSRESADVASYSEALFDIVRQHRVDLVVMAGFLSLVRIPDDFAYKVINIHPSLIPAFCGRGFYGDRVHRAVIERGVKISGCTVHFADNHYDHGPIILQQTVSVPDQATTDELASLVFDAECDAYPEAIRRYAAGDLLLQDGRVISASGLTSR
jgi:phosphoribosylglycinamide formyltransferase-1